MERSAVEIEIATTKMANLQTPMSHTPWLQDTRAISQCEQIWVCFDAIGNNATADQRQDIEHARFTECFLPVVTAAPAVIVALILLTYSLRFFESHRPRWTKPFVQEAKKEVGELAPAAQHHPLTATLTLLVASGIGLALQIITIFLPERQVIELYPSIAWVW